MNPLYAAVIAAVLGQQRRCPECDTVQVIDRTESDGRYHCKKCDHKFTKEELKRSSGSPR
jgi:ribosomal protein L37AE/L43A